MEKAFRRLTIYPGQISMVFNLGHSEEFYGIMKEMIPKIEDYGKRRTAERFLAKVESAIITGKTLTAKQSAMARDKS